MCNSTPDAVPLGIKPIIDFVFKKIFASPDNSLALIGLVNAILDLNPPIEGIEILNPFNYHEFAESKQVVLDVRCRDTSGKWLNVEMQISTYGGLLQRLVYYASSMYVDQLKTGQSYADASSSISICLLCHPQFRDDNQAHHSFRMLDVSSGYEVPNGIEIHTVELTKYDFDTATIASQPKLHQWAFLLMHAQDYNGLTLRRLFPGPDFQAAISTIEIISAKTEDKQMYDQREKAQRDYEWAISGARELGLEQGRELGLEQGLKQGREQGLEQGREQGLEQGREQGLEQGREQGKLAGRIQILQQLLNEPISGDAELLCQTREALDSLLATLLQRLTTNRS